MLQFEPGPTNVRPAAAAKYARQVGSAASIKPLPSSSLLLKQLQPRSTLAGKIQRGSVQVPVLQFGVCATQTTDDKIITPKTDSRTLLINFTNSLFIFSFIDKKSIAQSIRSRLIFFCQDTRKRNNKSRVVLRGHCADRPNHLHSPSSQIVSFPAGQTAIGSNQENSQCLE